LRKPPVKAILPQNFSTDNASGSTSQAAAVYEAMEAGCRLMLFDEDRSANNFMYKDEKMHSVIKNASTSPYLDNARMFYEKYGVSSIIVVGASGGISPHCG
jgi:predicted ABC-class ATPase